MSGRILILVAVIVPAILPLVLSVVLPAWHIVALFLCRLGIALTPIMILVAIVLIVLLLLLPLFDYMLGIQNLQDFASEFDDFVIFAKFSALCRGTSVLLRVRDCEE